MFIRRQTPPNETGPRRPKLNLVCQINCCFVVFAIFTDWRVFTAVGLCRSESSFLGFAIFGLFLWSIQSPPMAYNNGSDFY